MTDSMSQYCSNCEAQAAEIERLREALGVLAPMVNWLPHPDCVTAETAIRAALAGKAEQ
jgi:hypothetical protein